MKFGVVVISIMVMFCITTGMAKSATLFFDNFNDNQLNPRYVTDYQQQEEGVDGKPNWVEEDGVLKQTVLSSGDPTYCLLTDQNFPASRGLQAKVRFDDWQQDHGRSRIGLAVWQDESDSYNGYAFVVRGSLDTDNTRLLNDHRAWNNVIFESFAVEVGQWFYMKMFINAEEKRMYGKVWYDGDPEPQEWTIEDDYTTFGAERFPTPFVGLCANAGTAAGGLSASSYDDFYVFDDGGLVPNAVEPGNKLATTWSEIRKSH